MATIAVIDDARCDLDLICAILHDANHTALRFQSPANVETRIASAQPDLVLLDVIMPARSGYEVLRRLRRRGAATADIPVVLVTSKTDPVDRAWGLRQGADGYVTKPFTPEQLLGEVDRHLAS
ncbi:MAG: response regulator [Acidobacteriota bacterium]